MATRQQKAEKLVRDSIDKMMEIAGYKERYDDLLIMDNWYSKMTMTQDQSDQWQDWFIAECKRVMKWPKYTSIREFAWMNLMYGLKIEQNETTN